jgi:DNA mismatch repair protein MutL
VPEIILLPEDVISKIAAGEVVESPASVVKELVENALDAGAGRITIEIEGLKSIRVTDDGKGMDREDAALAFRRHATSKIRGIDDIFSISTLGFRGEALPSIAAVARVSCTTRPHGHDAGVRVYVEGEIKDLDEVGCPEGTTVEVRDLFYNTPARKKFLKKPAREAARIVEVVENIALCNPGVAFRLIIDGKSALEAPPAKSLEQRLPAILGRDETREMVPVVHGPDDFGITVVGFVSRPDLTRSRRSIRVFINGRWIISRQVNQAVVEAYGSKLMKGRQPIAVIALSIPPSRVDVNVHPAKTEVRFPDEAAVASAVRTAVEGALLSAGEVRTVKAGDVAAVMDDLARRPTPATEKHVKVEAFRQATIDGKTPSEARLEHPPRAHPGLPRSLVIKGQVGNTYIIAEMPDSMIVVDQHAAHEKVTYEALRKSFDAGQIDSQELLDPVTVELGPSEARIAEAALEELGKLGFTVEMFGPRTIIIKGVPTALGYTVHPGTVKDIIAELSGVVKKKRVALEEKLDCILMTMACHTSVRAGKPLELHEMQSLVELLYSADDPYTCPHGRPTIVKIPIKKLEKWFDRA